MRIERITAEGLLPFKKLELILPEPVRETDSPRLGEVHLITGPNGVGKSRLLSGIVACTGNSKPLIDRVGNSFEFAFAVHGLPEIPIIPLNDPLTGITYGKKSGKRIAEGLLIFARSPSAWLTQMQVNFMQSVAAPTEVERLSFTPPPEYSKNLLQTIANVKAKSLNDMQKHMGKPGAKLSKMERLIGDIERELSEFFGVRIFFRTDAESSSLLIDWGETENMTISQAPDGLRSVLGWLVDIIMMTHLLRPEAENPMQEEMVVLVDEPETHLHPEWQRKIIPLAQKLLPNAQLLVATHSPFVVMSVNEGWIHKLESQADGSVIALEPKAAEKGDSYIHVMREIMNIPERYDVDSEKIMADFRAAKDAALDGKEAAETTARNLLGQLALRGEELAWIARAELNQLERELAEPMPA
jgi:predicted ATP-binding protein involved in virulence